jgi:phosphoribosylaminoimidazole carboxylase PurE protein
MSQALVSIVMGSDSDLPVMSQAADILAHFKIPFELDIVSAHRTPEKMVEFAKNAAGRGIKSSLRVLVVLRICLG